MINYKIDNQPLIKTNGQIKDMDAVLAEIPNTLRVIQELLTAHEAAIGTPTINNFRLDIQHMIPEAIRLTHLIALHAQKLAEASTQAGKELAAVEDGVKAALINKSASTPEPIAEVIRFDNQSFRVFQRQ